MGKELRRLLPALAVAAFLWFFMFSPWTGGLVNFWLMMSISAVVLTTLTLVLTPDREELAVIEKPGRQLAGGIILALLLWGIFWLGDKISSWMFSFARAGVDAVYDMKAGLPPWGIALLLLFLIGPAEELFWRGFVQRTAERATGNKNLAFIGTTLVYALVHIWSFNFMLIMAALVAGAVWGFIYRLNARTLPALIISHALWDALVFVIIPIQ